MADDPFVPVPLKTVHYLPVFVGTSLVQIAPVFSVLHVDKISDETVEVETLAVVNISFVEHLLIGVLEGGPLMRVDTTIVELTAVELTMAEMVEASLMQKDHTQWQQDAQ